MVEPDDIQKSEDAEMQFEFDEPELNDVHISDEDLEQDDSNTKLAKKQAKKLAKSQLTDEELKHLRRKKLLVVGCATLSVVAILMAVPLTRWFILNSFGLRSTMKFEVVEQQDKIPVSNVSILLDGTYFTTTDSSGNAKFENVKLGTHAVVISKNGYSRDDVSATVGLVTSTTKLEVKAIGIKVNLDVRNWLTTDAISGATVSLQKDSVKSDKTGRASIVVPPDSTSKTLLQVSAPGYQTQNVPVTTGVESKEVALVSDSRDYFVSKRDGKYDIFSSYVDGTDQKKVIEATGREDGDFLQFTMHRGNRYGILVANRDGKVSNNRVVAGIYVVDFASNALRKIDEGSDVQLLDWGDDTIVYQKSEPSLNYDDPSFTKLEQYNPLTGKQRQIAQANYFSAALVAQNKIFYAGASGYTSDANTPLTSIDLGNGGVKTYLADRTPSVISRSNYDGLTLLLDDNSYHNITIKTGSVSNIDRRVDTALHYGINQAGNQVIWADKRDGQGTLLVKSTNQDDTKTVTKLSGLTSPTRWVSDRLAVVRVVTTVETADYLVDVPTGKTIKIVDVSDVRQVGVNL